MWKVLCVAISVVAILVIGPSVQMAFWAGMTAMIVVMKLTTSLIVIGVAVGVVWLTILTRRAVRGVAGRFRG
ncbi:hypothetical protein HN937_22620 [Candidatus Poribacteria bacterium]|nr:hypothetical protein [Candidatus Poribacteria bacterium]